MRHFYERYPGDQRVPRVSFALWQATGYLHETELFGHLETLKAQLWRDAKPSPLDQYSLEVKIIIDVAHHEAVITDFTFGPEALVLPAVRLAQGDASVVLRAAWSSRCLHFERRSPAGIDVQIARHSLIDKEFVIEHAEKRAACSWLSLAKELLALDIRLRRLRVALGEPYVPGVREGIIVPHLLYRQSSEQVVQTVGHELLNRLNALELEELLTVRV